jgi:hypothetical protein
MTRNPRSRFRRALGSSTLPALTALLLGAAAPLRAGVTLSGGWNTVDGGGRDVTGGIVYTLRGTVGQPDVRGIPVGGVYSLQGGFWRGAYSLLNHLVFADGFEFGGTGAWSDSAALAAIEVSDRAAPEQGAEPGSSATSGP